MVSKLPDLEQLHGIRLLQYNIPTTNYREYILEIVEHRDVTTKLPRITNYDNLSYINSNMDVYHLYRDTYMDMIDDIENYVNIDWYRFDINQQPLEEVYLRDFIIDIKDIDSDHKYELEDCVIKYHSSNKELLRKLDGCSLYTCKLLHVSNHRGYSSFPYRVITRTYQGREEVMMFDLK